jgi:hypothetical protein
MNGLGSKNMSLMQPKKVEARYAYYRRCQEFCKSGEQCKAPAEKGEAICHAHAEQRDMAACREAERRTVLELAAAEMARRTRRHCSVAEMLMSFDGIQTTIAVAAQALIKGTLNCKTAGRLLWELQCMATLLRTVQRAKAQTTKDTKEHKGLGGEFEKTQIAAAKMKIVRRADEGTAQLKPVVVLFPRDQWSNGPPGWAWAA